MPKLKIDGVEIEVGSGQSKDRRAAMLGEIEEAIRRSAAGLACIVAFITLTLVAAVGTAGSAQAGQLIKDGQKVVFVTTTGPDKGTKYVHVYKANAGTLGPVKRPQRASKYKVLKNSTTAFIFRGPRDTCALTPDHKVKCGWIGDGTWQILK